MSHKKKNQIPVDKNQRNRRIEISKDLQSTINPTDEKQTIQNNNTTESPEAESTRLNRRILFVLLAGLGIALFFVIKIFIIPVILAISFTTIFYPLYNWFLKFTRGKKTISSILCCLVLIFGLLIPLYILIHAMALEFISLYNTAEPQIKEIIYKSDQSPIGKILQMPWFEKLSSFKIDWQSILFSALKNIGSFSSTIVNKTSSEILSLIATMIIMFFTMFYLFIDGPHLLARLRYLSPLRKSYEEILFKRFLMISRATIRGTIIIGLAQGTLGALTFLFVGINSWLLWGFIMVMFSLIPFTGAWMVMLPAAAIQLILGNYWTAAIITFMCIAVVSTIDNILRPKLVGKEAKMHDLVVLFSTLGGIAVYGILGFIIGPVIAAMFIAVIDMYGMEYKDQLNQSDNI
jgi:predicted PurR-regulated permease PerM